jgi:small conductance mechanosensitive channel
MSGIEIDKLMPAMLAVLISAGQAVLRIALILLVGLLAVRVVRRGLERLAGVLTKAGRAREAMPGLAAKRAATLTGILRTIAIALIWTIAAILSLSQVGLDVTPILAGAGILGLAVGFGAQNLVRDLISGFFLVLEDQVRVGDVAVINGTGGLVETVTFRTVVLRDLAGVVHVFPNGAITTLSNMTYGWSGYVLDIGVAYKEDTDRVVQIMRQVADELQTDPAFGSKMLEPIEIFGVDNFADSAVIIKARLKTMPIEQWTVGREYRRRLKKAFDAQGIEIPFPHRTVYMGAASPPFSIRGLAESGALAGSPGQQAQR